MLVSEERKVRRKIRDLNSATEQKVNKQYIVNSTTYRDALIEANDATEPE